MQRASILSLLSPIPLLSFFGHRLRVMVWNVPMFNTIGFLRQLLVLWGLWPPSHLYLVGSQAAN